MCMFFGMALKRARKAAGLTGAELASRVGRSRVTISRIETGRLQPSRELVEQFAQVLGVDVGSLYRDQTPGAESGGKITKEETELLASFRQLASPWLRARALGYVAGLLAGGTAEGAELEAELAEGLARAEADAAAERKGDQSRRSERAGA